ncbi:Alanine racemase [Syntrophomonas zehnderi OL-4]|uniref:Alanine racemase n=1 Tax=Syntrophomonas zehnderi OL-4 TaxID=690567 RepID=A0A0E4GBL3_9FIRM|nr:alanine racemase [Syntrophomonas zehnderi]CFX90038.1 Alanine racemase [Syntrophomonas zehnderi OL-4]
MDNPLTSWAEIDLRAIRENIAAIKRLLDPAVKIMSVVKANAYGHGMIRVAQTCIEEGATYLGVATLEEALALRAEHITAPILVLGYIPLSQAEIAVQNHIDVTVYNLEAAQTYARVANSKNPARLHIKIDTGMGRIGFQADEAALQTVMEINRLPNIVLQGIYTHFATADELDKSYTRQQNQTYTFFIEQLEQAGIHIPIKHTANSAAIMDIPETHGNMVRAGIIIYGLYPSDQVKKENLPLKPAMRLKTRISHLKTLPAGRSVSYGRRFVTDQETVVATVPVGYADGYSRLLSNRAWASVNGQRVPLIGTVCMDQCMFDVSEVKGVKTGDEVLLFGRPEEGVTADDLADLMGTINYEIVSAIGSRIPRIYLD